MPPRQGDTQVLTGRSDGWQQRSIGLTCFDRSKPSWPPASSARRQSTKPFFRVVYFSPFRSPTAYEDDIAMDFITRMPRSQGYDCILVIVDRLSKYAHFIPLRHPYFAATVTDSFIQGVVRLHGFPRSIISDRDPLFLSIFWTTLFHLQGSRLRMSTTYHPQTDGQSEALNRCLETYLRYFVWEEPRNWAKWLRWAEYSYNTSHHQAANTTPFEIVYGRPPPYIVRHLPGECLVESLATALRDRDTILDNLKHHLQRAQQKMVSFANRKRRDLSFEVGEKVLARIKAVASLLRLPSGSRIHLVFHVSQLRRVVGEHATTGHIPADLDLSKQAPCYPASILDRPCRTPGDHTSEEVLVAWTGRPDSDATWLPRDDFRRQFADYCLEDKTHFPDGGIVTDLHEDEPKWQVYTVRRKYHMGPPRSRRIFNKEIQEDKLRSEKLRLHLVRLWRVDPAGGNGVFEPEGRGGCSKQSFLGRFSRRAGGNGANAAGGSFVYPPSGGVCPKRSSETPKQIEPKDSNSTFDETKQKSLSSAFSVLCPQIHSDSQNSASNSFVKVDVQSDEQG
ncbi:hypothetical protein KSP39_PZI009654 [Platanthera zijinensis]|uniref:Integrase catalytic domain-containing protein n=1 Tax=Platanthera zijinensis TaxID=2320716 RepID=A0AAP0BLW5_9ASPA